MNTSNTEERKIRDKVKRERILNILKKTVIAIFLATAAVFALMVIYQVLEVLFVLAVLIVGSVRPRRW